MLASAVLGESPTSALSAADGRIPLEAFFGQPNVRSPRLSPDGKNIAFLFPHENHLALGLFNRETNEARLILRGRDESIAHFFWKGNEHLVFLADVGGNESFFIGSTDLSGKRVRRIAESQHRENSLVGTFAQLIDELRFDDERVVASGFFTDDTSNKAFIGGDSIVTKINVRNRSRSPLFTLDRNQRYRGFIVDHDGALRICSRLAGKQVIWEHRAGDDKPWETLARHPFHGYAETWEPLFFARDNRTLYLISRSEHDSGALYALDTASNEHGPAIFIPPAGEIVSIITSYDRSKLLGVAYEDERLRYHWFDETRGALQKKLENTFPGMDVRVVSTSADEQVQLVYASSDRDPGAYLVLDRHSGALTTFRRVRDIDPTRLSPMQPIAFTARDGLTLHGYLTLPSIPDGTKRATPRLPLIIHPHGGPFGVRDSWGFNPEVQFYANRGYAVLQINYRGSGGYGRKFVDRGRHQWGRMMQDDLTDAIRWAVAEGIADPTRVAISGASYGGYAALAGVTLTPELYRCAVNYVGAADLEITFKNRGEDAFIRGGDFSYQEEWVGPTEEYRNATSPVLLADRIRAPTLHAYGEKDPRVKIDHWTRLEAALKKYHKPYTSIEERRQGHGFRDTSASLNFYAAVERFLATHLAQP